MAILATAILFTTHAQYVGENKGENKSHKAGHSLGFFCFVFCMLWLISHGIKGQRKSFRVGISFHFFQFCLFILVSLQTKQALYCYHVGINLVISWAGAQGFFPHECAYEEGVSRQ